ncbi:MarR family winged helix-turn-helix transcriptional regulator [Pseudonocardia oroxyli]|uniref:DNA-binding transcriptional regulator, MarR family n=1 Tax=Pseudonocardia oroxyli TaxID=366584 RepID=A0A1G7PCN7_PSEOR|nr:MarR family winged helix-turn-helix transcriptional regulator [Pseudonocardia oroxyli]SDF84062.1 DNA-binding transcriptional regulator, MarR family [Pseudonocardia oroxyli]
MEGAERLHALPSRLLGLAALQADRIVGEALAGTGARKWHYAVLATLVDDGPAGQARLAERSGIYRSDLVGVLAELGAAGHVDRVPDPTDRRRNVVSATAAGVRRLAELDGLVQAAQERLLAPLDRAQRAQLVNLLRALTGASTSPGERG